MYQALYGKYRPTVFADVIGQEPVTKTLKNQIKNASFGHAYLFTGTRGTGKTTCARIFAKAVNCLNPVEGEPCGECEICRGIADKSIFDITEIDAATNSGVDSVRELREEVAYAPVHAKKKVYIIDEVHMLSPAAYNALLKTIEEPPEHAIFILATTEINKVPATIMSRCQRFDFRRVSVGLLTEHLSKIVKAEGAKLDRESLITVARLGDGSVRDSLSVLDKVIGLENIEDVRDVLGVIDTEVIHNMMKSAAEEDIDSLYTAINKLYNGAKDLSVLARELLDEYRNLLIVKNVREYRCIIDLYEADALRLREVASLYTTEHILYAIDTVQQTLQELTRSSNKRADMEICLLRISHPRLNESVKALTARVTKLEEMLKNGIPVAPSDRSDIVRNSPDTASRKPTEAKSEEPKNAYKSDYSAPDNPDDFIPEPPEETEYIPEPPSEDEPMPMQQSIGNTRELSEIGREELSEPEAAASNGSKFQDFSSWNDMIDLIYDEDFFLSSMLEEACTAVFKGTDLFILCKNDDDVHDIDTPERRQHITNALQKLRKIGYTVHIKVGKRAEYIQDPSLQDIENNPLFKFE